MRKLADRSKESSQGINSIVKSVISAYAQEVAAASEELNGSTEEVSTTAEHLNTMTKELVDNSNKFKL